MFFLLLLLPGLSACTNHVSMVSADGETWTGRWRYSRGDNGLMHFLAPDGEILIGAFTRVQRSVFVEGYEKTFGGGTIALDGPDLSSYGNAFAGFLGVQTPFSETAYAEPLAGATATTGNAVSGSLFYWTASMQGDKRTSMQCFFIGSSHTGHGIGRCRGPTGKEYLVEF
jgi:hypothetical protein